MTTMTEIGELGQGMDARFDEIFGQLTQIANETHGLGEDLKGGKKGGKARTESLTPERRSEIAARAAKARWTSGGPQQDASAAG